MHVATMILSAGLCLASALPALAQTRESGTFDIYVRGFKFGTISYSAVVDGNAYATASRVEASGLIGALVRARYDAESRGTVSNGRFVPALYEETAERGDRSTVSTIRYSGGVPRAKEQEPPQNPRPTDIDPAAQGGTVDPSTAIFASLGDVAPEEACKLDLSMYDGRYRARITISQPQPSGDGLVCAGAYTRVAGYSDKEMSEGSTFPFTARYAPNGEGKLRMVEIGMKTLYGNARVERR